MKLTLDIVPSTCWGSNLRSELTRAAWDRLRRRAYRRAKHRCEICGGQGWSGKGHPVECHEVWSYDEEECVQRLERLIALCPPCHEVKHYGRAQVTGNEARAFAHLRRVNKLSQAQALLLIQREAALYEQRSSILWDLDVSILDDDRDVDTAEIAQAREALNLDMLKRRAQDVLLHPLMVGDVAVKLLQRLEADTLGTLPYILGASTPSGRPTAEAKLRERLAHGERPAEEDCGTAKPRHPCAPCDREGERIAVLHEDGGTVMFCYPGAGHSSVYLGEYDADEGVVTDIEATTRARALRFFQQLSRGA